MVSAFAWGLVAGSAALGVGLASADARLTARDLPPIPQDLSTPYQQRLAYDGPTGMTVAWNTFKPLTRPTVHYGFAPGLLLFKASSSLSATYNTSRTWSNTVHIGGLLPATTYYYKIDSTNSSVDSFKTARVAGDPTPFNVAVTIDMGVFGPDGLGTKNVTATGTKLKYPLRPGEHTSIQRLVADANSYEFVLHPGDLAYADAWLKETLAGYLDTTVADGPWVYESLNEQFYDQLSAVSRMRPYMVAAGNHEANCVNGGTKGYTEAICPVGQTNFTQFINRFGDVMPGASSSSLFPLSQRSHPYLESPAERSDSSVLVRRHRRSDPDAATAAAQKRQRAHARPPFWYSFTYGMATFLVIDTETDLGVGLVGPDQLGGGQGDDDGPFGSYLDEQVDWLEGALESVDRRITPWVIVAGHRPWYVANGFPCIPCQTAFEPLFNKYGVDLAIFGHTHNMERHVPTANNVTDPAGLNNPVAPMYIVNGAGGHYEGLEPLLNPLPYYTAWGNDTIYGISKLLFHDRQHLEIQFIKSDDGTVLDSSTLFKKHDVRFVRNNGTTTSAATNATVA